MLYGYFEKGQMERNQVPHIPDSISKFHEKANPVSLPGFFAGALPHLATCPNDHVYQNNDIKVVFSGSIYNANDIASELSIDGQCTPSELAAWAFIQWGPDFVSKFNGDFAICVFHKENTLYLYRDHLGVHPVFYSIHKQGLYFSGDYRALCLMLYPNEPIEPEYLLSELKLTSSTVTPNRQVVKLPPGNYLKCDGKKCETVKYWFPERILVDEKITLEEAVKSLQLLVSDAVKIRSTRGVPSATHMSGGLDSGLISVFAKKHHYSQKPYLGFSYSPSFDTMNVLGPGEDERFYVQKIGEASDIVPVYTDLSVEDYEKYAEDSFYNFGSIWEERICEIASDRGIRVLFSGWGGDEFISKNYTGVFFDLAIRGRWNKIVDAISYPKSVKKICIQVILKVLFPIFGITWKIVGKEQDQIARYIKKSYRKDDPKALPLFYRFTSRKSKHLKTIQSQYIAERCEKWYLLGMRHGISYRYPLLDYRILEYVMKLPSEHFVGNAAGRNLIREVSKGILPDEVLKNQSKLDKAAFQQWLEILNTLACKLIPQIPEWEANPDLHVIDFHHLKKESSLFLSQSAQAKRENLPFLLSIHAIKKMHEFSKVYHSGNPIRYSG